MTMKSGLSRRVRELVLAAAALLMAAGCAPLGVVGAEEEAADPYTAAATTNLRGVVAGLVGDGVLLQNHSPETLNHVEIVLNPQNADGGFSFRVDRVGPNSTNTYVSRVFRNTSGTSLNPSSIEVTDFAVFADTPRGRGSWRGQYGPNGN